MKRYIVKFRGQPPRLVEENDGPLKIYTEAGEQIAGPELTTVDELLKRRSGGQPGTKMETDIKPRVFYPRIWRDGARVPESLEDMNVRTGALRSGSLVLAELEKVFNAVEPCRVNEEVFGHALRHILVRACMDVEACWQGILEANHCRPTHKRYSTEDYVKLLPVMRLDQWQVNLGQFQDFQLLSPFVGWDPTDPTDSLRWYAAHHKVKHRWEKHLAQASLRHCIDATAALVIMVGAAFGSAGHLDVETAWGDPLFWEAKRPSWGDDERYYGTLSPDCRTDFPFPGA